ncbi:uncharacterized protein LOC132736713 [Ruditapes philippinarum]|uniref:uncharacterized protein LOC132736713 n=1 Tax=Ruditapes philippinarum TaxID=129788 RepID=UPI00295BB34F|nr:uncharacterized protein LOC132736713 [Ruditapes philippinarum]
MKEVTLCSWFLCLMLLASSVEGLQCPSCTYLTSNADINVAVRTVIDTVLNLFQDPKCAGELKGPVPEIKEETCEETSGQVARCSFYKGSVTITIPLIVTSVDVPLQMYQRGCYHSKPANVPSNGCHNRDNINEDKTVIKQILDKASSTFENYNVAKFTGEMCLCTDTYCRDTSAASQRAPFNILLLLACVLIYLVFVK